MTIQDKRPAATGSAPGGDQLRAAGKVEFGWYERLARHPVGVWLKQVDLSADVREPVGEVALQ